MTINELQKVYDISTVHFCHKQHKMMQLCKSKSMFIPFVWHHESEKVVAEEDYYIVSIPNIKKD